MIQCLHHKFQRHTGRERIHGIFCKYCAYVSGVIGPTMSLSATRLSAAFLGQQHSYEIRTEGRVTTRHLSHVIIVFVVPLPNTNSSFHTNSTTNMRSILHARHVFGAQFTNWTWAPKHIHTAKYSTLGLRQRLSVAIQTTPYTVPNMCGPP